MQIKKSQQIDLNELIRNRFAEYESQHYHRESFFSTIVRNATGAQVPSWLSKGFKWILTTIAGGIVLALFGL